jgi:hypothetical protein
MKTTWRSRGILAHGSAWRSRSLFAHSIERRAAAARLLRGVSLAPQLAFARSECDFASLPETTLRALVRGRDALLVDSDGVSMACAQPERHKSTFASGECE